MQLNLALSDNAYNNSYCVHLNQTKLRSYLRPRTTDTRRLKLKFFAAKIQMPLPNNYLGVGYKGLVFCRNNGKHGQETHSTKMGADSPVQNTPNAQKPKSSRFP